VKNLTRKNCGKKCDNCRHPKEQQEVTKDMIQALQVIQLLKGKFNLKHTVDVITGTKSQAVMDYEHHNLECFGLGKAKDPLFWKSVIRTALLAGFVTKDIESYGLLKMNEKGDVYLKKPTPVFIALDTKFEKVSEDDDNAEIENFYDEVLFAQLKELRKKVAKHRWCNWQHV
jgi:ATP-dependent DNA helicase RecQ